MEEIKTSLALVTGAARRVGRALAITLACQSYAILLHYYHSEGDAAATINK
jgi:NAD(P)-dependent dehydrogenase (short-subunit alcohol dehydrogenase family)